MHAPPPQFFYPCSFPEVNFSPQVSVLNTSVLDAMSLESGDCGYAEWDIEGLQFMHIDLVYALH